MTRPPRPAPYDGYRMAEVGDRVASSWLHIADGGPPSTMKIGLLIESPEVAGEWCVPWPEDDRR